MNVEPARTDLSLVVPVYNERDNLAPLLAEAVAVLEPLGLGFEVLFVDDGSTDGSAGVLEQLQASEPRVRVITFACNAGQTAALDAGFQRSRGELVVTMDADLQNDPADIPRLLQALEGHDAVVGLRRVRRDHLVRRISSRVANYVRNRVTEDQITDTGCSLKVYRREALKKLRLYNGMHRFLPTLLRIEGFRVRELQVNHRPRRHGTTKYGVWNRLIPSLYDLIVVRWMKKRSLRYEVKNEP